MREAARSIELPLDRTWKGQVPACQELSDCGTVHTLRVKLVGTPRDSEPQSMAARADVRPIRDLGTTQRIGCMQDDDPTYAVGADDTFQQALAFARTIPALTPEELGFTSSGVRDVERLALWLEPRDRSALAANSCSARARSNTLRISANPLTRAWQLWHQLPAPIVLCAAATLCVLSALALGLFAN